MQKKHSKVMWNTDVYLLAHLYYILILVYSTIPKSQRKRPGMFVKLKKVTALWAV